MPFSSRFSSESPEARFWRWIRDHDGRLFAFERDQNATLDALARALGVLGDAVDRMLDS